MIYSITPCPKPRMTQSDKWKKRPAVMRYWAFKDEVRLKMGGVELDGSCVVFFIPMPKSWSKKRRDATLGHPHRSRPDISNLLKALEDALYGEDSHIASYGSLTKVWSDEGQILVKQRCRQLEGERP